MLLVAYLKSVFQYRELLLSLIWRDFCTRYKQAVLGLGWALLYPMAMTLTLWVAFQVLQRAEPSGKPPLLLYYTGIQPFNLFASGLIYGTISIVANGGLLTKIKVPTEAFPISAVASSLFDFLFGSIALAVLMVWFRDHVHWSWQALWIVPTVFGELLLTLALVQVLAAACVIARDLRYAVPILCQLLLFLVPVVYEVPQELNPAWKIYLFNPLATYIDTFRRCLVYGEPPHYPWYAAAWVTTLVSLWISCRLFQNARWKFADLL
jgi:lipopolysaccharide transport system permease protein